MSAQLIAPEATQAYPVNALAVNSSGEWYIAATTHHKQDGTKFDKMFESTKTILNMKIILVISYYILLARGLPTTPAPVDHVEQEIKLSANPKSKCDIDEIENNPDCYRVSTYLQF